LLNFTSDIFLHPGLAEAAVHPRSAAALVPASFLETSAATTVGQAASRLKSLVLSDNGPSHDVHAFTVLARILNDPELGNIVNQEEQRMYSYIMDKHGDALLKHVKDWHIDTSNPQEVSHKLEELLWTNVLIYGVGGWDDGKDFNADFFQ
jgi:hypothetical protein